MTLVDEHPSPASLGWLGLLRYMLPTASLSTAEDPASVSPLNSMLLFIISSPSYLYY